MPAHPPVSKAWECHAEGCLREREGYSHWCVMHKDTPGGLRGPLLPCPCHGLYPSGMGRSGSVEPEDPVTMRRVVSAVWAVAQLMDDGTTEGEPLADMLKVPWSVVRNLLGNAIRAGYIGTRNGGYYATPLGDAWLTHGNRGARGRLKGRASR